MSFAPIQQDFLSHCSQAYQNSPERQIATLALSKCELSSVMFCPSAGDAMSQEFSVDLKTLPVADQGASGRCWLFAATNVLRERIAARLNLEEFELSQSYLAFWDKFERCNYFLESILETAAEPVNSRVVSFILSTGVHDGGQWEMFSNIVRKYGIVPKNVYTDTYQANHTRDMNGVLNRAMKAAAIRLRRAAGEGASADQLQQEKQAVLSHVYGFLCSCYGEPPKVFDFVCVDADRNYHAERGLTPLAFAKEYVGDLLENTASLIHAPTQDKPFGRTFTIRLLGNVAGGHAVCHLNLSMEDFKQAVIRQLQAGKVVWFGSDVGHDGERTRGIWDDACFRPDLLTGLDLKISKGDCLDYGVAAMNHAMVLTGVNLVDGKPTKWKIENSWGDKNGKKGYYVCSGSWFDQYVFQAAVEKEYLGNLSSLLDQAPIELDPWDPMGTLAD